MAAARGGLIESRTEVEKASPKGTKAAITALMSTSVSYTHLTLPTKA